MPPLVLWKALCNGFTNGRNYFTHDNKKRSWLFIPASEVYAAVGVAQSFVQWIHRRPKLVSLTIIIKKSWLFILLPHGIQWPIIFSKLSAIVVPVSGSLLFYNVIVKDNNSAIAGN
jgi:hypothetical protein